MTTEPTSITDPITYVSEEGHTLSYVVVPVSELTHEEKLRIRDAIVEVLRDMKARGAAMAESNAA